MIFTRDQYIDLLKHRINSEFGKNPKKRKKSIALADYCNPNNATYDRHFIRILLSGMKFAGISHNSHDITPEQVEALINFLQVCSWADFYIIFKLFPYMPIVIIVIQMLTLITLLKNTTKII